MTCGMDVRDVRLRPPSRTDRAGAAAPSAARRGCCTSTATPARVTHTVVPALPDLLRAGDLLVVNNTRVFPARLLGRRVPSGGAVECLLVARLDATRRRRGDWEALCTRARS